MVARRKWLVLMRKSVTFISQGVIRIFCLHVPSQLKNFTYLIWGSFAEGNHEVFSWSVSPGNPYVMRAFRPVKVSREIHLKL